MVQLITRAQWGARAPTAPIDTTPWSSRNAFITHYSAGSTTQTVRQIQNFQMDTNGWRDIGYNFLVDVHGNAYEGRLHTWLAIGAHAANNNTRAIGVCFIGSDGQATPAAKATIRALYDEACARAGRALQQLGHRDVNPTSCPGDTLYAWVRAGMPSDGGIDMSLTPDQQQQLNNIHDWLFDFFRGLVAADPGTPHIATYVPNQILTTLRDRPPVVPAPVDVAALAAELAANTAFVNALADAVATRVSGALPTETQRREDAFQGAQRAEDE